MLTAALVASGERAAGQSEEEAIAAVRSLIKADRQAYIADTLQLTDTEAKGFWPLYQQYRAEMDKAADGYLNLVKTYAAYYPEVPDDQARKILKELNGLDKKKVATRASYLKKFGKILPPPKNLRFAQAENRLDLAVQLKVASEVPLVPFEGRLRGEGSGIAVRTGGVPGGAMVQTYELTAVVTAINQASRKLTLMSQDGIKQTVKVGPDAVNFDRIRVGDRLNVRLTEELVVKMAGPGEPATDGAASLVALAPKGAKPGALMAETTQVTATVRAIDRDKRTATLRFEDGTIKTFPVREDVDLGKRKVGEKVLFTVTETLAVSVKTP